MTAPTTLGPTRELFLTADAPNGSVEYVWRLPSSKPPRGLVLLAHGCRQSPRVWFERSTGCPECIPRPEERCLSERLSRAGYALLAAGNMKGSKGCWETNDVPVVSAMLRSWRRRHEKTLPKRLPLFLLGPSSGGFLATQAARQWGGGVVRGLSIQVSVPSADDVRAPGFPKHLQVVLLQKDAGKLKEAEALRRAMPTAEVLVQPPVAVPPHFFSDAMPGLAPAKSAAVRDALVAAGHIDGRTSMVRTHPSRGTWRDAVRAALEGGGSGRHAESLQQGSLQLTMDGIFARLDLAYGYHASTCEVANKTLAFFERLAPDV